MKLAILCTAIIVTSTAVQPRPHGRFTAPQQPWSNLDSQVRLLRPAVALPDTSQAPLGSLMSSGWRLVWDGASDVSGSMAVRLALPVVPITGAGQATEVLQVGWSAAPSAVRTCLTFGLAGGSRTHLAARTINRVRFAATGNQDAGMSQSIDALDLRAVVHGRCYAVERFSYSVAAADPDPKITLPQARGAGMLDAALASLRLGPDEPLAASHLATAARTIAR